MAGLLQGSFQTLKQATSFYFIARSMPGKKWFDWMVDQNPELPIITNVSWEDAAAWVADAWRDFDPTIIKNRWQKTDFNYF